jgi:hypothetical protein
VLDREVAAAVAVENPKGLGVLLTRRDARAFTVEASRETAAGTVLERDLPPEAGPLSVAMRESPQVARSESPFLAR